MLFPDPEPMNLYLECRTEGWTHQDPTYHFPISQQQMDCPAPASSNATSTPGSSPTPRSRKPGAVIESFVNHAPGVFSGTFSGRCHHWSDLEILYWVNVFPSSLGHELV